MFLRSDQIDTSLLDQDILESNAIFLSLNKTTIQSIDVDTDLIQLIKDALPGDRNIGPYIELLKDPTMSRDDDVKMDLYTSRKIPRSSFKSCSLGMTL